jgi:DNA-directed RNA polymerase specialized sigma24 family protein
MSKRNSTQKALESLQQQFLNLLPDIERYAGHVFRRCRPSDRDDLVSETVARVWLFFLRLSASGKDPKRVFRPLLRFSVLAVKDGRRVGGRRNSKELCHRARRDGLRIVSLESWDDSSRTPWREILAETRAFSPAETAAARMDIEAWLKAQPAQKRSVARYLALGESTSSAAKKFRISCARISQLRRELQHSWHQFQQDSTDRVSITPVLTGRSVYSSVVT